MQQNADIYLLLNYSICFGRPSRPSSGVHKPVFAASGTDYTVKQASSNVTKKDWSETGGPKPVLIWSCLRKYDLHQRLELQFYVLLMLGVMDARNMWSNLVLNKYLHTVVSRWISST